MHSGPRGTTPPRIDPRIAPPRLPHHTWTFLTNHGHVLLVVAKNPDTLVEDIATTVGITPRATLQILKDLEDAGYLHRIREGRRTHYSVDPHQHFRHPATSHEEIGALLGIFTQPPNESIPPNERH